MKLETLKSWITRLLLGFVLVSIGFAVGKEVTMRRMRGSQAPPPWSDMTCASRTNTAAAGNLPVANPSVATMSANRLIVYYLHGNIRCVNCNEIETAAHQIVENDFTAEQKAGRILWQTVNFDLDPALARKYDVASSTVLLVRFQDNRETASRRLDEVWTLSDKPAEMADYIHKNIQELLP